MPSLAFTRYLHEERNGDATAPAPDATPELALAWHSLALYWLGRYPSYRREISTRVVAAIEASDDLYGIGRCVECGGEIDARRYTIGCDTCSDRRYQYLKRLRERPDVDNLGREVEGCG